MRRKPSAVVTGRPPAGVGGDKSSEYPMLAVRVPPGTKAVLKALALQRKAPLWAVVAEAVVAYVATLPEADRRLLAQLAKRA